MIFENETVTVTKIYTVVMHKEENLPKNHTKHYSSKLHSNELIFFLSGNNRTCFKDVIMKDEPNSLRFLPKNSTDGEYYVKFTEPSVCCIDVYFETEQPLSEQAISLKNMSVLKPLFEKLYQVWQEKKRGYYSQSLSIFYEIIHRIQMHHQKYFTNQQQEKIMPSYDYMLKHFSEHEFDYKEMCAQSGFSYGYFKELFLAQYGISPVKYVTMLKIEKAKELIITRRYSISEIAETCGFENVYYFSNVFKKITGVSPKNYHI